jgi:hypothetical protein
MTEYSPLLALFALIPSLRRASGGTLSVYVPARAEGFDSHYYDLELGHLERQYRDRLSDHERQILDRELPRVRAHLEVIRPAGSPALAGFADEPNGVLELIGLRAKTEARLEVGEVLIAPLLRQLEDHPPALIAVVDKEEFRAFGAILDDIRELDHLTGSEVRHSRAGGTSAESNQRKAENRARANLEAAAQAVEREMDLGVYPSLYIAGPTEARVQFERLLPDRLRPAIAGHLGASLDSAELKAKLREQLKAL